MYYDLEHYLVLDILAPTDFFNSYSYECGFRKPHSTEGYRGSTRWPLYCQSATLSHEAFLRAILPQQGIVSMFFSGVGDVTHERALSPADSYGGKTPVGG